MAYLIFKFLHVLGIVLLVGNVTVTAVWKVFADRTREPRTVAFAQRLVTGTDWAFTGTGIVLTIIGGYGMLLVAGIGLADSDWLLWGQILFVASGSVWAFVLLPIQIRQARMARAFANEGVVPDEYWRLARGWIIWGVAATVPLVGALYLMIMKP